MGMKIYDVIILGAGASGLMCAANLGKKLSVAVIDVNDKVAKKLKISGGGKCNITNTDMNLSHFDGDVNLVQKVFKKFSKERLLEWLERNHVALELRKGRYYFCKKSSDEIINLLKRSSKNSEMILNNKILEVVKNGDLFEIKTDKSHFYARNVVVATGGESYNSIGASSVGLDIAKSFHIKTKEFRPALVGLTLQKEQFWMKELSGLSCYVEISVEDRTISEEMLFAHRGISGPAVLSASLYWKKGEISIDFLPKKEILKLVKGSKKLLSSVIPLPKRLSKALLNAVDIKDKECNKLTAEDREKLKNIHSYSFAPAGNFGFTKAEVSRGGVLAEELNNLTLEAKNVAGLYFIGEVVDVTGELGGYNFQWAFSSAYYCAKNIN